jgi:hypothetical protein
MKRTGCRSFGDESWVDFLFLARPVGMSNEDALEYGKELAENNGYCAFGGVPGLGFAKRPIVRVSYGHILILQFCGLDV